MGQVLSNPVTDKHSASGSDDRLIYGVSSMQGWRLSMEDAHSAILDLHHEATQNNNGKTSDIGSRLSFFGVYDGHGGSKISEFTGEHIHKIIARQETFEKGDIEQALKDGFLATDRAILDDPEFGNDVSGCTVTVGIISSDKIYVANAGDSRGVLGIKGRAKPLSFDHKPYNEGEKARIVAAGGQVEFGRINKNLALSRAIGDFAFKQSAELAPEQQIVIALPDVIIHDISSNDEFLVIACDGIWDCRSSQEVVEFVRRGIADKQELSDICENIMNNCISSMVNHTGIGCDNMTVMIIGILHGKSKDEWYEEIASRVANGDGPCAPPEYAERRGPNINCDFEDSDICAYNFDLNDQARYTDSRYGRIIILGDGSEILSDPDDTEIFDNMDEVIDLSDRFNDTNIADYDPYSINFDLEETSEDMTMNKK